MKVKEVMTSNVRACFNSDNLATAAQVMWDNDCGCVPVLNEDGLVGGNAYRSRHLHGGFLTRGADRRNQSFRGDVETAFRLYFG